LGYGDVNKYMENQTSVNGQFGSFQNKKWPWIVGAVAVVGILIYFVIDGGGSLVNNWSSITEFQNTNLNQTNQTNSNNSSTENKDIDNLLNQLDLEESRVNQSLNDTPIDIMTDD
jgi:predicted PurR-regulated permease PerM